VRRADSVTITVAQQLTSLVAKSCFTLYFSACA
jgi:hypothetical protein